MSFSFSSSSSQCFLKSSSSNISSTKSKLPLTSVNFSLNKSHFNISFTEKNKINSAGDHDGFPPINGGGSGGGGEGDDDDHEEAEFGPILKFDEVMRELEKKGATLPSDMMEAAKSTGIRRLILERYLDLQDSVWPLGVAMGSCSLLRDRMLADPSFLFKVGTEIVIDSCCATFAKVQKKGKDFWAEFELYAADLLVGIVVDIALVGLLAPYVRIGKPSANNGFFSRMTQACNSLPSIVFEAKRPGSKFSVQQWIGTYFYKGVLYGTVGFVCGIVGQGIANLIMTMSYHLSPLCGFVCGIVVNCHSILLYKFP